MLTPQEVAQHAFTKATFGGYTMSMVDEFLDTLTEDYTALYKENAVLKSKMKVLVDKIEEYRTTEEAMRSALLTAQKMANALVAEAEEKKAQLLREAENIAKARTLELHREIAGEEARLAAARRATAEFTAQLREMLAHEIGFLDSLPELELSAEASAPAAAAAPAADQVAQTVKAIESSMQKLMEEAQAEPEPEPEPPSEEDLADTKDMTDAFQKAEEVNLYDQIISQKNRQNDSRNSGPDAARNPAPPEDDGWVEHRSTPREVRNDSRSAPPRDSRGGAPKEARGETRGASFRDGWNDSRKDSRSSAPREEDEDEDEDATHRIDFANLQFGKDYEIL